MTDLAEGCARLWRDKHATAEAYAVAVLALATGMETQHANMLKIESYTCTRDRGAGVCLEAASGSTVVRIKHVSKAFVARTSWHVSEVAGRADAAILR